MSQSSKTLNFLAAKLKGFTVSLSVILSKGSWVHPSSYGQIPNTLRHILIGTTWIYYCIHECWVSVQDYFGVTDRYPTHSDIY